MSTHPRLVNVRTGSVALAMAVALAWTVAPRATVHAAQKGGERTVFTVAVDATGKPLKDLTKADWAVREDGADRAVVDVKPAADPMQIALLVDVTKPTQISVPDIRAGVLSFIRRILAGSPNSLISIGTFSGSSTVIVDFKNTAADLEKGVGRLFPDETSTTVLLEAIVDAGRRLSKVATPRRVIVALNLEGFPETTQMSPQNVAKSVIATGASLWAVSYRNAATQNASTMAGSDIHSGSSGAGSGNIGQARDMILNGLTAQTGGARLTVTVASAIETSLNQLADALLSQYAVTYTRPDGPMPKVLQMGVARPGAHVLVPLNPR
jgi:hypothetical protein